jgi:HEAT repeat protein
MDEAERLIEVFRAPATASVASRLSALMNLEQLGDPRIVRFFLDVLADEREPKQVRLHVLKRLRSGHFKLPDRALVAESILRILSDHSSECLRAQATLALAEFTDIDNVPAAVGSLALNPRESIDLRYSAFTSLQRAGPTTECVALLRQLSTDEELGGCARGVLSSWHLE